MRRTTILSLAAAGLAALVFAGTVAAAGPHAPGSAGAGSFGGTTSSGFGGGRGAGHGTGIPAMLPAAALGADQAAHLQAMAEEEKLAMDLYTAFAARYGDVTFSSIAQAEARHLFRVQARLARYEVADPTAGLAAGRFATPAFQDLYDQLLSDGSASLAAAWAAGRTVEVTDIADLDAALADGTLPWDVARVYTNLRAGSGHHLAAFEAVLGA